MKLTVPKAAIAKEVGAWLAQHIARLASSNLHSPLAVLLGIIYAWFNSWVINWLVIDYRRWSMSNQRLINAKKFCGPSITHRCHRLPIDIIDCSLMLLITHWLPIDYSCHFSHVANFCSILRISVFFFTISTFPCTSLCPEQFQMIIIGKGEL